MKKIILILLFLKSFLLYAQTDNETNYQRYDIVQDDLELRLEGQLKYWFDDIDNKTLYSINPSLSAELIFLKSHSIKTTAAYTFFYYNNDEVRQNIFYAPNDIL
jgi:hypothetical protein